MGNGADKTERPALPDPMSVFDMPLDRGVCRKSPAGGNALAAFEDQSKDALVCRSTSSPHDIEEMLWRDRIGEASTAFDHVAHVCAPLGLRVRREARSGSAELGIIPFDTRVHVQRRTSEGWAFVTVIAQEVGVGTSEIVGESGFVESRFLLLDPPDKESFLHLVKPGEGAARLAAEQYAPPGGFSSGYDAYLFVSALWASNQHLQTAAGPYPGAMKEKPVALSRSQTLFRFEDQEESLRNYLGAALVAGNALWIPSITKVRALMRSEAITSATVMAGFGEEGGFLRGLLDGIEDGLRDLVAQAKQLARLLYDLMNDGLIDLLVKLVKKISELISHFDMHKAVAAGKRMALDFIAKWSDEDPYLRGHFQGKTIGYLVVLILPMVLTEGVGEIAAAPRAVAALEELSTVADTSAIIEDLSTTVKGARVGDKLMASGYLPREGILADPFPGGLPAIKENFEPHLKELFGKDEPFGGIINDRKEPTEFFPEDRTINFQGERNMNLFSASEEVQHAIDYTLGATDPKVILEVARAQGVADADVVNWWHRRVFTRMINNINNERFGMGYLKPRIAEVYGLYSKIGGKLTLEQILKTPWEGLYDAPKGI